jgi:hypothetical protein
MSEEEYVPGGHFSHGLDRPTWLLNVPAGHALHRDAPALGSKVKPMPRYVLVVASR